MIMPATRVPRDVVTGYRLVRVLEFLRCHLMATLGLNKRSDAITIKKQ